jgi:hypothetical protein
MRAAHLLDDDPKIFRDDFALRFGGCQTEESLRAFTSTGLAEIAAKAGPEVAQRILQAGRAFMTMCSRYSEDALSQAIAKGITRYVILGAGTWNQPQARLVEYLQDGSRRVARRFDDRFAPSCVAGNSNASPRFDRQSDRLSEAGELK